MAATGLLNWRGKPIDKNVHGGVRAAWFLYFLVVINFLVHVPNLQNMVTYLRGVMHIGVSDSSTTVTNFLAAMCGFALLGGFISDSYVACSRTMLLSVPLVILGYGLLALQAYHPALHPAQCNAEAEPSSCKEVNGWNSALLYIALYIIALGEGVMRACIPAVGADQFGSDDLSEARQQSSFFNWFTFCLSIGSIAGLILIVWIENTKGWGMGFGLSALLILFGLLVSAAGLPFYRNRVPQGSALTRVLQVFVVAFKNRKLVLPENTEEAQENSYGVDSQQVPRPTNNSLKFLDKACINTGRDGPWSVCSSAKVEETKIVLRMLPIAFSSTVAHIPSPLLVAFTVQQGMTTNTRLGRVHMYPAMLFIIPSIFQMLMLAVYDQFLVPLLRRRTGYKGGITQLQRVGVGFLATAMAPAIAAVVERQRKKMVLSGGQMSLFWLAPQFFLIGVADTTSFVGLLEFFNNEAPNGMKSIGVALFWCQVGISSLLGTLLVKLVNKVTQNSSDHGWLEGANLNNSHLDLFYWVVAAVAFLGWVNYLYWSKRYKYRHDQRIATKSSNEDSMP
ncbi:unnamed protein product [Urochloa decumbens]|uniref:Uncharacterized protein n=1 Tax=Urochloa decumbens TaxID=240449 RepID=A0ABC9BTG6_9POAL